MKYRKGYSNELEIWLFNCDICGEEDKHTIIDTKYPIKLKIGWFNSKEFAFCNECIISLNMKYGCTQDYSDEIYYGYDTFIEQYKYEEISSLRNWQKGGSYWYEKFNDKILRGNIVTDIKDFEKFKENIIALTDERKNKRNAADKAAADAADAAYKVAADAADTADKAEIKRLDILNKLIIKLLKEKAIKMPASDIDAHLKHQNIDEIKELCEEMYHNGEISRTGNYRYFILSEEKKKPKPKKASAPKSESTDIPEQIKKLSDLKDQEILTEEEFQSKKKDLLDKM